MAVSNGSDTALHEPTFTKASLNARRVRLWGVPAIDSACPPTAGDSYQLSIARRFEQRRFADYDTK